MHSLNRSLIVLITAELAQHFWFHLQTAVITYDYLTSLRSVPYGSEEYEFLKSQVSNSTELNSLEAARHRCGAVMLPA